MKKVLLICLAVFLLAIVSKSAVDFTGITGFVIKAGSTVLTIARTVIKGILSVVIKIL